VADLAIRGSRVEIIGTSLPIRTKLFARPPRNTRSRTGSIRLWLLGLSLASFSRFGVSSSEISRQPPLALLRAVCVPKTQIRTIAVHPAAQAT